MTKQAIVKGLREQGLGQSEIVERTGFSYDTVAACLYRLRNPEKARAQTKAWNSSEKGKAAIRAWGNSEKGRAIHERHSAEWRKRNPEKLTSYRRRALGKNQNLTRPKARNHGQEWTIREIEYLQQYGPTKTIKEHALYLGRTYKAVDTARKFGGITFRKTRLDALPVQVTMAIAQSQ